MKKQSLRRRLALIFTQWTHQTLPLSRRSWAKGMHNELAHIENDWQVLRWATGCLVAACGERIREIQGIILMPFRLLVILLMAFKVFDDWLATAGTIAYRMNALGLVDLFGRQTPGDDYMRLIPLMEAIPTWLHGLWVTAGFLYLLAIALLIFRREAAYIPVLLVVVVEIVAGKLGRPIVAETAVVVNPNPSLIATLIIPIVLPLVLAVFLWLTGRRWVPLIDGNQIEG